MVKDHSENDRANTMPALHRLPFPVSSKGSLYAPSHRQDSTNHGICYTSGGTLAGMRNSLVDPLRGINPVITIFIKENYALNTNRVKRMNQFQIISM